MQRHIGEYNLTQLGNSERFIAQHRGIARYHKDLGGWFIYDGKHWEVSNSAALELAKRTVRSIYNEVSREEDDTRRRAIAAHAKESERECNIKAMLRLAQTSPKVAISPTALDQHHDFLNVANGTLDLRSGALCNPCPESLISKLLPIEYDSSADCPNWLKFLKEIFCNDQELINFVHKALGYSCTGHVSERCIFIAYGEGRNGKSTLLEVIRELLSDSYAQKVPTHSLMGVKSSSIENDIARLKGVRFSIASETEENCRFREARIKELTGGDRLVARFLHKEHFEFDPTHKLWLATNHQPKINGNDEAIWDRIRLIPFNRRFKTSEVDYNLRSKLLAERKGILNWLIEGAMAWHEEGLGSAPKVEEALSTYRAEMDTLNIFLSEETTDGGEVKISELYEAYREYSGDAQITKQAFSKRLLEKRSLKQVKRSTARYWSGIRLDEKYDKVTS
jgi:putative DNA primase/helicase